MAFKQKIDIGNGEQFKFEKKGQMLEGYYIGSFDHDGDYGLTKKHIFQDAGGLKTVFGQTHLTQLLEGIAPGVLCQVTMTGTKPSKKGNPMKVYSVAYDEEQTIDTAGVVESAAAEPEESYEEEQQEEEQQEEEQQAAPPVRQTRPAPAPARAATAAPKSSVSPEAAARANRLLGKR